MTALFIVGPADAGKDAVCDCLKAVGWNAQSTSYWYFTRCVNDRRASRMGYINAYGPVWREALANDIAQYNQSDGTNCRLYREMIEAGCQAVNGVRRLAELKACVDAGLVREIWWIDAAERLKDKPPDTTLDYGLTDITSLWLHQGVPFWIIDSNGTVDELIQNVQEVLSDDR